MIDTIATIEKVNLLKIRTELLENLEKMIVHADTLGAATVSGYLREMSLRLDMGFVRIAIFGQTSSGKSTTQNAIVGNIVVPENPDVATPIPVWIGYHDSGEKFVVISDVDGKISEKVYDKKTFLTKFCYNTKDQIEHDKTRFEDIKWGAIHIDSKFLESGITMIDTLGIGSSPNDSFKSIGILNDTIDIVIFETFHTTLLETERDFIRTYLLGLGDRKLEHPIKPENLIILHNDHDGLTTLHEGYGNSIRTLFNQPKKNINNVHVLSESKIDDFLRNNVVYLNAWKARINEVGVYPYKEYAPDGSTDIYLKEIEMKIENEEDYEFLSTKRGIARPSDMDRFRDYLVERAHNLMYGDNSVAVDRVGEVISITNAVREAAENKILGLDIAEEEIKSILAKFELIKKEIGRNETNLQKDLGTFGDDMQKSFKAVINSCMKNSVGGAAFGVLNSAKYSVVPDKLITHSEYRKLSDTQKFEKLRPVIEPVIIDMLKTVAQECVSQIWSFKPGDEIKETPGSVIESSRRYMLSQCDMMSHYVKKMDEIGVKRIGVLLPDENVVNGICSAITLKAEETITLIFDEMKKVTYWDSIARTNIGKIKRSFFGMIGNLFTGGDMKPLEFWKKVKESVIMPVAVSLFEQIMNDPNSNAMSRLLTVYSTDAYMAYHDVYRDLIKSVQKAEADIAGAHNPGYNDMIRAECRKIISECKTILGELNNMLRTFQGGRVA